MPTEGKPPKSVVGRALTAGALSKCAKSKRGVAIYAPGSGTVISTACNEPPHPFECAGDARCRTVCNKVALHAEERAIHTVTLKNNGIHLDR